jgi:hypothetical protein
MYAEKTSRQIFFLPDVSRGSRLPLVPTDMVRQSLCCLWASVLSQNGIAVR